VTTITSTSTSSTTVSYCSSTKSITVTDYPSAYTCGATVTTYTSGSVTCANDAASPSADTLLRIEGGDTEGTIFEDCIIAGPCTITTPSGGTHLCDGTNDGANPTPFDNMLCVVNASAAQNGFTFDGTYDTSFDDYFISRIGSTSQTPTQFWGTLDHYQFTPVSDCQYELHYGSLPLWAFDAFNKAHFLEVTPGYMAVTPATQVTVTVTDGSSGQAVSGASINSVLTDANGKAVFNAPTIPGCYQFKATKSDSIRSNAFYLSVVQGFGQ